MTLRITTAHNEARLTATLAQLDAGTGNAAVQVYGGTKPGTISGTPSSAMLVEIELTKPAGTVAAGALTLTQAADGLIAATGQATWARFVNGDGAVVMDADCSDMAGSAEVKLVSTQLYEGGDARLASAVIG